MTIIGIFLINQIRTGGDRDYIELLELLAERGNDVIVIINSYLNYTPQTSSKNLKLVPLPVKYIRHRLPPASYLFKKAIKKKLDEIKKITDFSSSPSFIHIHGTIYLKSAIYLKKHLKIPFFYASRLNDISKTMVLRRYRAYTARSYLFSFLFELIDRFREKQIAKYADLICFLNPTDKQLFISRTKCNDKKTIIIPNNIGLPHFTDDTKNKNNSKSISRIVYVGGLSPAKGLFDLLKAAAILKEKGANLSYHILGRKENESRAFKLIEDLGLKDNVILEGFANPFPFFINCDLFVYPTLYDDWGNVVTEALHCGCPVIASDSTGPSFILKHEELLFPLGNPEVIAEKIKKCIDDNNYYQKIRSLCAERASLFYFDWPLQFEKAMLNYLEKESKT